MTCKRLLLVSVAMGTWGVPQVWGQDYDIVILKGRVMDPETKFDEVRNVGINKAKSKWSG